jgi:hypothetical protein
LGFFAKRTGQNVIAQKRTKYDRCGLLHWFWLVPQIGFTSSASHPLHSYLSLPGLCYFPFTFFLY